MSTSTLLIYIFLVSASFAFIMYGKKQRKIVALFSGIALALLPYFDLSILYIAMIALILMVVPFFIHK